MRLSSGGTLPLPPGWKRISGDPGTASAAVFNADGTVRAYLNATPADAAERLAGWARFRVRHNAEEGNRDVTQLGAQTRLLLGAGRASCVSDMYATSRSSYRELACVVAPRGAGARTVLVAAAQPRWWPAERATLEYAIDHFKANGAKP